MSRIVSMTARQSPDAMASDEVEVVLIKITHEDLSAPVRLTTDPTERISTEPLVYGTRSAWGGADPMTEPYLFVLAYAVVPGEAEDAPATGQILFEALDARMAELLRSITSPATFSVAVVMASSPDLVEQQWVDLMLVSVEGDAGTITLHISREEIELNQFPAGRMSRAYFPGLWQ